MIQTSIIQIDIIMKKFSICIFLSLIHYCISPHFGCPKDRPFITGGKRCGSFSDICLKSGSEDCDFAIKACEQCPLSNFSSAILDRVLRTMYIGENKNCSPEKIEMKPIKECQEYPTSPLLWIILIVLMILTILITVSLVNPKCFHGRKSKSKIFEAQSGSIYMLENISRENEENIPLRNGDTGDSKAQNDTMNKLENILNIIGVGTCFKIPQFHKTLKLIVHENENIVSIKRKICANLVNTEKIDDFKMMQLQYNGEVLDDNQCLPKTVCLKSNTIHCFMNEELKNSTTLLQLRGNIYVPEMIQLEKSVDISQLKQIVNKENINLNNLFIIKGSEILESNKTIGECKLEDNDLLKVIKNENRTINVKQVFKDYSTSRDVELHIDNIGKVGEIKSKILTILDIKQELKNIFLFHGSKYLNDDMFYFEFDSGESNEMSYCNLVDVNFLFQNQKLKHIGTGDHNEIYESLDWSRRKIILKKSNSNIKENQSLINELMMFHETISHSGFVQMLGIFRDENNFYVAVEKMSDNSISDFIKGEFPISESRIIKWSRQILEGLEFLHSRQIIHRNIKPSNILLKDDGNKAKISGFGLSRRLYRSKGTVEKILFSKVEILRYMAPEMYLEQIYSFKSDVYSFGATLTEIVTGKEPFTGQLIGKDNFVEKIEYLNGLTFRSENAKLDEFVNQCINPNYNERPFISELRFDKFLRQKK